MSKWKLVDVATGTEIRFGDLRKTFNGERVKITGFVPPHKAGSPFTGFPSSYRAASTGKVFVNFASDGAPAVYFPSAIDARYDEGAS